MAPAQPDDRRSLVSMPADALDLVKQERPTRLYPYTAPRKYLPAQAAPAPPTIFMPMPDSNNR
jgi:hypothetical protein